MTINYMQLLYYWLYHTYDIIWLYNNYHMYGSMYIYIYIKKYILCVCVQDNVLWNLHTNSLVQCQHASDAFGHAEAKQATWSRALHCCYQALLRWAGRRRRTSAPPISPLERSDELWWTMRYLRYHKNSQDQMMIKSLISLISLIIC